MHSSHSGHLSPRLDLWARDGCIQCDTATPQCNCSAGEKCILTSRTCNQCPAIQCIKSAKSSSKSLNPGAIAGPIVAVLVIASFGLFWWLRRKKRRDLARLEALADRARKAEAAGFQLSQPGSPPGSARSHSLNSRSSLPAAPSSAARARSPLPPAPVNAEYYDENGATIRVYKSSRGTIDLDKTGDPFSDRQSISTMGSGGTANIIPIQYIPPSKSDEALSNKSGGTGPVNQSAAARRLDEARQNLLHPKRPARAPDLDLRLTVPRQSSPGTGSSSAPPSAYDLRSPGGSSSQYRDSYLSGNSAAPSYWSGQSDVHLDAPKIVTSKQVQVGRLQQAEVVQFGKPHMIERLGGPSSTLAGGGGRLSPVHDAKENPFNGNRDDIEPPSALSPTGSFQSGEATIRTLTPMSNRRFDEEEEEGLRSAEPSSAGTGDLRFSMGSLAYRDSVSTMGTGNFMASASNNPSYAHLPPPLPGSRMSNGSSRSFADSVLGAFPMIPPHADGNNGRSSQFPHGAVPRSDSVSAGLPQSTSVSTLDHAALSSRPPALHSLGSNARTPHDENAYTEHLTDSPSVYGDANTPRKRPETQASVADSFLGSFPFLHPGAGGANMDDMATLPSGVNSQRGVSTTSEGLGGFDFRLGDAPPVPVPATRSRSNTREQK
ncbi:hypothetical protein I316_03057 [Kwoniella heveanensis BCC8398]|uniref:Membrane anchor Opy2 N-terminal domain-containing protein n=1 Tax=Kwoniella heveanensis BCC8398 TaxID=1296120 RepID=A0A1B9GVE9_9TREE|nr:hypothetical protein I316_03057 [Kwoniella heveanensis BCC8398]